MIDYIFLMYDTKETSDQAPEIVVSLPQVRFKGLAKNTAQVVTLFALANLYLARKRLLPTTGQLRVQAV